jgi:hypothetical protein
LGNRQLATLAGFESGYARMTLAAPGTEPNAAPIHREFTQEPIPAVSCGRCMSFITGIRTLLRPLDEKTVNLSPGHFSRAPFRSLLST